MTNVQNRDRLVVGVPMRARRSVFLRLGIFVLGVGALAASASGCAKARAETVADGPPLVTPAPPPRVLAPVEEQLAEVPPPPEEVPTASVPNVRTRQPPRRTDPERPPEVVTSPPAPAAAVPVTPEAPRELRAASSPADAEAERKVREMLSVATRNLNGVDYRRLTSEGKAQYDQAKRFVEQADEALKERNLVLAETVADKAVKLAAQLGR